MAREREGVLIFTDLAVKRFAAFRFFCAPPAARFVQGGGGAPCRVRAERLEIVRETSFFVREIKVTALLRAVC